MYISFLWPDLQSAEEGGILDDNIPSDNHEDTESEENGSESFDDDFLPNVYLSLAPEGVSTNDDGVLRRNLTLILNSKQRVKWYLESIDLSGHLKVISTNGPVYDYDLSPDQQLSIENNPLPAAFDQLWKAVVRKTNNNPISSWRIYFLRFRITWRTCLDLPIIWMKFWTLYINAANFKI